MRLYLPFEGRTSVTSPFGMRVLNGVSDYHKGVDLVGVDSGIIISPCDGVIGSSQIVTDRTNLTWQWGNYVRIDTEDGYHVFMCHMASRNVEKGQRVRTGDVIGVMGNTGYSLGSHTHFELRNDAGVSIDPCPFLNIQNNVGTYERTTEITSAREEESEWSVKEGWWKKATKKGIINGKNPRGNLTREQFIAVLGRLGLI